MRIVMGMAYCLQYMHHELNPPVTLLDLQSTAVFITDDFAAKASICFLPSVLHICGRMLDNSSFCSLWILAYLKKQLPVKVYLEITIKIRQSCGMLIPRAIFTVLAC